MAKLSFLTWNVSMLARSDQAPPAWGIEHSEAAIRERVLDVAPDVVCFQELPAMVPFVETHGMVRSNPKSHQGHLAILARLDILADEPPFRAVGGHAVLVTLGELTIANVHLTSGPGKVAADERFEQLGAVIEASPTGKLVVIGDTNTRRDEIDRIGVELGLSGDQPPAPTWDSRRNRFNADGPAFTAHFTRWFATEGVVVDQVSVLDEPLEIDDHRFHLSDHYPLRGRVSLCTLPSRPSGAERD